MNYAELSEHYSEEQSARRSRADRLVTLAAYAHAFPPNGRFGGAKPVAHHITSIPEV
jgi:hypothetical protein